MIGRDRLRDLLDAVLADDHRSLADMAGGAHSSPFHFSRLSARDTGEPPVSMRRRVELERAAWQLASGAAVTEVAFAAGYGSVDGFARAYARAYGHPPSATPPGADHRLPAPNGIHFHAPHNLWVAEERGPRRRRRSGHPAGAARRGRTPLVGHRARHRTPSRLERSPRRRPV